MVDQPSHALGIFILYLMSELSYQVLVLLEERRNVLCAWQEDSHEVLSFVGLTHDHLGFHNVAVI